jgi:hypothetical protein
MTIATTAQTIEPTQGSRNLELRRTLTGGFLPDVCSSHQERQLPLPRFSNVDRTTIKVLGEKLREQLRPEKKVPEEMRRLIVRISRSEREHAERHSKEKLH